MRTGAPRWNYWRWRGKTRGVPESERDKGRKTTERMRETEEEWESARGRETHTQREIERRKKYMTKEDRDRGGGRGAWGGVGGWGGGGGAAREEMINGGMNSRAQI